MAYYDKKTSDELKDKFKDLAVPTGNDFSGLVSYFDKGLQGMDENTGTVDNDGLTKAPAFVGLQTQVDNNAQELLENYEYTENRLYIDGLEKDKYIERNGDIKDYSGWALSDYLPVEKK